ncbi:MAG: GNAT family N-acetyltransferase, partial [Fusobacteriaceae bacterium]
MVRLATTKRDKKSAYELWSQCFTDSISYIDYYFSNRFKMENYLVLERDGNIMGGMHSNPYSINFCGHTKKTYYLVAVGTYPEYRGMGVLKELMEDFFKRCEAEKIREIFLLPINPEIYAPYGFAYTHYLESYEVSLDKVIGKNHKN